jgi:transmembrane sensor
MTETIPERAGALLYLFVTNALTVEQQAELDVLCAAHPIVEEMRWKISANEGLAQEMEFWYDPRERIWEKMEQRLMEQGKEPGSSSQVILMRSNYWMRYVVAAVVLSLTGLLVFYAAINNKGKKGGAVIPGDYAVVADIAPASDRATLQLADGSVIALDNAANGQLAEQGQVTIKKADGTIIYDDTKQSANEVGYNVITTPRGGKYQVQLPDGSKVWLNAASSLRFPAAFVEKGRHVELEGEAFFDVVRDVKRPFTVGVNGTRVEVLGTTFNVMAYADEPVLKTTLLTGKVQIRRNEDIQTLAPGQQAVVNNEQAIVKADVDVEEVVAWKNGYFVFSNTSIGSIFRDIARWYNVEIVYESKMPVKSLSGIVSRTKKLSAVLDMLREFGINTRMEQGKIIVLPQ